jgi:RNase P subunit RPR2
MSSLNLNKTIETKKPKTYDQAKEYVEGADALQNSWQTTVPDDYKKLIADKPLKKGGIF